MFALLLNMASGIIIARVLGPERRGYFGMVFLACSLLFTLGHMGIGTAIAYFTGKQIYSRDKILKFMLFSALGLGTAAAGIFLLVYRYIGDIWTDVPPSLMILGMISVPFSYLFNFLGRYLLATLKVKQANITNVLYSSMYFVLLVIFLVALKGGLKATVIVYATSFILTSITCFIIFTRDSRPMAKFDLSMAGPIFGFGVRAYLIALFTFLNYKICVILVKHY